MAKRTYKTLTIKQTAKVKKYTKAGKNQAQIAKLLGVSKQRVATAQKKAKVGKRVASPFWKQVSYLKKEMGYSHKAATKQVWYAPKWAKKRVAKTGKKWKSYEELRKTMRQIREEIDGVEDRRQAYEDERGEFFYGDTPR